MARGHFPYFTNAVANEYIWGNTNVASDPYTLFNDGTDNELLINPAPGLGNALYSATNKPGDAGPFRVGIFAASAIPTKRLDIIGPAGRI